MAPPGLISAPRGAKSLLGQDSKTLQEIVRGRKNPSADPICSSEGGLATLSLPDCLRIAFQAEGKVFQRGVDKNGLTATEWGCYQDPGQLARLLL
jgi:hypothetical protein